MAVLTAWPDHVVNRAILKIGLSVDPFPDLGKIVSECDKISRKENRTYAPHGTPGILTDRAVEVIASRLEINIKPKRQEN